MIRPDSVDCEAFTRRQIERPDAGALAEARRFPTSTLHEAAGKIGALPFALKPVSSGMRLCGPAITVHSPPGDNLWIHRALYVAKPGDILVVYVSDAHDHGYWGEIMSTAALARELGGLVIDGCVRDGRLLGELGFPVFARGLCMTGTGKDFGARGWINAPIHIGGETINAGDVIVGDEDGVVCLPRTHIAAILAAAAKREAAEADIIARLRAGEDTLSIYGWNTPKA